MVGCAELVDMFLEVYPVIYELCNITYYIGSMGSIHAVRAPC